MYQSGGQSQSVDGALPSKTPVSLLQELCMRRGISPKYDLLQIEGPVHEPTFVYRVTVGEYAANGSGQTKKKAKHAAAKAVLDTIIQGGSGSQGQTGNNSELSSQIVSPYDDGIPGNPIGMLQELCMSRRWPPPTYELTSEEGFPHERTFSICATIGTHKEIGAGKSKKLAKRQAAHKMIQKMKDQPIEHSSLSVLADDDDEVKNESRSYSSLTKACLNREDKTLPLDPSEVTAVNRKHAFSHASSMLASHSDNPLNGVADNSSLFPSTLDSSPADASHSDKALNGVTDNSSLFPSTLDSSPADASNSDPNKLNYCPYQPLILKNDCCVCKASVSVRCKGNDAGKLVKPGIGPLGLTESEITSIKAVAMPVDRPVDSNMQVKYSPTELIKLELMFEKLIVKDCCKGKANDERKIVCNGAESKQESFVSLSAEEKTQHLARLSRIKSVKLQMLSRSQVTINDGAQPLEALDLGTDLAVNGHCEVNGMMNGHSTNGFVNGNHE